MVEPSREALRFADIDQRSAAMSDDRRDVGVVAGNARTYNGPTSPSQTVGTEDIELNKHELQAGVQAGLGAGVAMGLVAIVVSLIEGYGFWTPFNDVAGTVAPALTNRGADFSLSAVIVGILVHFTISVLLGVIFAALYSGIIKLTFQLGVPMLVGFVFGMMTWAVVRFIALPALNSGVYGVPAFITAHAVFGATLGLLYPLMPARRQLANAKV
jgi:hypothetical protein